MFVIKYEDITRIEWLCTAFGAYTVVTQIILAVKVDTKASTKNIPFEDYLRKDLTKLLGTILSKTSETVFDKETLNAARNDWDLINQDIKYQYQMLFIICLFIFLILIAIIGLAIFVSPLFK